MTWEGATQDYLSPRIGGESGFATTGTYRRTGDAFGMTGGSTKHMTYADSPADNVAKWFSSWGPQVRGVGSDKSAFLNALQGRDASGAPAQGWNRYNLVDPQWETKTSGYIKQMLRDIPLSGELIPSCVQDLSDGLRLASTLPVGNATLLPTLPPPGPTEFGPTLYLKRPRGWNDFCWAALSLSSTYRSPTSPHPPARREPLWDG
jgi:hypothetical protein